MVLLVTEQEVKFHGVLEKAGPLRWYTAEETTDRGDCLILLIVYYPSKRYDEHGQVFKEDNESTNKTTPVMWLTGFDDES